MTPVRPASPAPPRSDSQWVVVLAGGVGSRFWPLSTAQQPKQLLSLVGEQPLLVETLERLAPLVPPSRTLVLTNASLVDAVARTVPAIPRENIIAEPRPAGTAAALAWAAHVIMQRAGREATMISVHADWAVGDADEFRRTLGIAAQAAEEHRSLVTVGIVPTRADPGFGYIEPGDVVSATARGRGIRQVARFVEKPSRERAAKMREEGYLWNSGIFAWIVSVFLDEVDTLAREIDLTRTESPEAFFAAVRTPISVDHAVLERSQRVLVVAGDFGWDDVGTWGALQRVRMKDAGDNAISGRVHVLDARNNVVHAEPGQRVVLYGVKDLVVIAREGLTVVTTVEGSADLKRLVESLPADMKDAT